MTIERIRRAADSIGPATAALCDLILERQPHPEQGFRACLGTLTYGSVRSILDHKLDRAPPRPPVGDVPLFHANIRGPRYYH